MHLRIVIKTATPAQVEKYFIRRVDLEQYYSENQEFNGNWGGKGAAMLGLLPTIREEEFSRLCHNLHPITGEQLTPRMKEKRRIGADFNWNCPKSVSLAYAFTKDERIIQAVREAIRETMIEVEQMMATRVRKNGRDEDRPTGVMVYAEYVHLTARPENGIPDPHLHAHCYVFNNTFDPVEKRWKAAQMGNIVEEATYFQGACRMRVEAKLKALGLEIERTEDAFEIKGITRELVLKFSHRMARVEEEAARRGITDEAEKGKLAALTRENKVKELTIPELEPKWWARLSAEEKEVMEGLKMVLQRSRPADPIRSASELGTLDKPKQRTSMNRATRPVPTVQGVVEVTEHDRRAVAFAVEHLFERQSVVTEKQLMAEAFASWCVGKASLEGIKRVVAELPLIRRTKEGRNLVTTVEVCAEEARVIAATKEGKNRHEAINPEWKIEDQTLNAQQREAVMHVLRSKDFAIGISGKAGTGKTTLLHEARRGIEAGYRKLLVFAPTAEAAREVLRKQGFLNAETVAKLLVSEELQKEARQAVWWIDEAGLLSTRGMDKLLKLANQLEARVVLVGDCGQHHAVERGQAFDLMQRHGEMATASVEEIQRQKRAYKRFVEFVAERNMDKAFMSLVGMDSIFETTLEERKKMIAADYVSAIARGKTALVVAPTHAECRDVTEGIRDALKEQGVLKSSRTQEILRNLSWTGAQKSDPEHYEKGMIVQINSHVKGYSLGERMEVIGVRDDMVRVRSGEKIKAVPLWAVESFAVYERDAVEICEGEKIRITANGRSADNHRLNNRDVYTVDYFDPQGRIVLNNGWRLDKDFAHLDRGYAMTSNASQGKTVDYVFVAQSAQLSLGASDANQFYVSVSRGRLGVKLYTDDIELLKERVSVGRNREMATDMLKESERETGMAGKAEAKTSKLLGTQERNLVAENTVMASRAKAAEAELGFER